jgi:hypothetical protein
VWWLSRLIARVTVQVHQTAERLILLKCYESITFNYNSQVALNWRSKLYLHRFLKKIHLANKNCNYCETVTLNTVFPAGVGPLCVFLFTWLEVYDWVREASVVNSWPNFLARSAKKFSLSHNLHINTNIIVLQILICIPEFFKLVLLLSVPNFYITIHLLNIYVAKVFDKF